MVSNRPLRRENSLAGTQGSVEETEKLEEDLESEDDWDYHAHVDSVATERKGDVYLNDRLDEAIVIVERMIADADRSVLILAHNLDPEIYCQDKVLKTTEEFLSDPDHRMRIILEENDQEESVHHPFLSRFMNHPRVEIRYIPASEQDRYGFYLLIADADAYRFVINKLKSTAVYSFGEKNVGRFMVMAFAALWDISWPSDLSPRC